MALFEWTDPTNGKAPTGAAPSVGQIGKQVRRELLDRLTNPQGYSPEEIASALKILSQQLSREQEQTVYGVGGLEEGFGGRGLLGSGLYRGELQNLGKRRLEIFGEAARRLSLASLERGRTAADQAIQDFLNLKSLIMQQGLQESQKRQQQQSDLFGLLGGLGQAAGNLIKL